MWRHSGKATIAALIGQLNEKIDALGQQGQRLDQEKTGLVAADARLKQLAAEIELDLGFCALPGCGRPFVRTVPHARFCPNGKCKQTFDNKWRNQAQAVPGVDE
jgi:hypothetical protein